MEGLMDKVTATRKFLKKEQWIKLIRECQSSGMSVASWCKQNSICEQTYYKNLKKLREELVENLSISLEVEKQVPTVFKKLEVQAPLPNTQAAVIIHLPHATLEIADGTSQQTIQAVLLALQCTC
jgi:transposase-like protein